MRSSVRPFIVLALFALTSCASQAVATGDYGGGTTTTEKPTPNTQGTPDKTAVCHKTGPSQYVLSTIAAGDLQEHLAHGDIWPVPPTGCPDFPPPDTPPTTRPHESTTTKPPHESTTTKPPHESTTTKPPHESTTTVKATTTTAAATTTTVKSTTTTTGGGGTTTTKPPTPGLFSVPVAAVCPPNGVASLSITFGNRPDLNGMTGILTFDGGSPTPLVFQSNTTVVIPWPEGLGTIGTVTYTVNGETATAGPVEFPEGCVPSTTTTIRSTTTTTGGGGTTTTAVTTSTSTTGPGTTTTTTGGGTTTTSTSGPSTTTTVPATTTTLPSTFSFGGAATVCRSEVPTIVIDFSLPGFPSLAGRVGILTMSDVNGNVVSTQELVYQPGGHVELLYPGTTVNPDGSIADVPGWILTNAGLWVRDPSDEFLRDGIHLSYTVNPTAEADITYPPESSVCANPENPPTTTVPGAPPGAPPAAPPGSPLPPTGNEPWTAAVAALVLAAGATLSLFGRRRKDAGS